MTLATDGDRDQENALTSSDLRSLLKAASLTEFRLDAVSEDVETEFVKSSSLFDLVRSNLLDDEPSSSFDGSEITDDNEKLTLDEIKEPIPNELVDDETPPKVSISEEVSLTSEIKNNGLTADENLPETQNVVDSSPGNKTANSLGEGDDVPTIEDAFEGSTLVDDVKDGTMQNRSIKESDEFLHELQKLQLEFDRQLEDEKHNLAKTLEALFGASNLIVVEMENQISDFVLSVASDLAGTKIDELPTPFFKKIARVATQIVGNESEVTVHLNSEDFKVANLLKSTSNFNYKLQEKETLKRGEFEVLSHKSTAGVSLFSQSNKG